MKLVTFSDNHSTRIGVRIQQNNQYFILDLSEAAPELPVDMIQFLEMGEAALAEAHQAVVDTQECSMIPEKQVRLRAPIPRPGKIICVGLNYRDHAEEIKSFLTNDLAHFVGALSGE